MTKDQFLFEIEKLETACRKFYTDEFKQMLWGEITEVSFERFAFAVKSLCRVSIKLPTLAQILDALPHEIAERPSENYGQDWLTEVRNLYNECTDLRTQDERFEFARRLPQQKLQLLFHGKLLYETIWPQVLTEYPSWPKENQIAESLRRFPDALYRYFNSPKNPRPEEET